MSLKRCAAVSVAVLVVLMAARWSASADQARPAGQQELRLPAAQTAGGMPLTEVLAKRRSNRSFQDKPVSAEQLAQLCWSALGITEPNKGLRTAPSAMSLHGVRLFVVDGNGTREYLPESHSLHRAGSEEGLKRLRAATGQGPSATAPISLVLVMEPKRLEPRCGNKAERYCLLEAGHVAQNVLLQATALGLASVPVGGIDEAKVAAALDLPPELRPVYMLPVGYPAEKR